MSTHPVLIAGGGIAGIASAIALLRSGRASRVLEKASAFEAVGAGLQIGPNAVRALKYLDVWDAVAPASFAPPAIFIRDGHSGRTLQQIRLGVEFERRFGEPYRVIHRADLLAGLVERAKGHSQIELTAASEVVHATDKGGYVEVSTADGTLRGEAVIGADGIRSAIRQVLAGDSPPLSHGEVLFRALTAFDHPMPEKLAAITLWLCRSGHIVHYPVCGGNALNVVAAIDGDSAGEEWSAPADRQEVMARFAKIHEDLFRVLTVSSPWSKWAAADLAPGGLWSRNRIALIGDAAHASLPYLAQGAAMALEDAVIMALCAQRTDTIASAFSAFEAERRTRTERIALHSRRMARIYHAGGALRLARNLMLHRSDPGRFLDRMAWIYRFDPLSR